MKSCSHFQITTSEPLGLQSAGGEATAPAAAWGASRTGSAELIAAWEGTQGAPTCPLSQWDTAGSLALGTHIPIYSEGFQAFSVCSLGFIESRLFTLHHSL